MIEVHYCLATYALKSRNSRIVGFYLMLRSKHLEMSSSIGAMVEFAQLFVTGIDGSLILVLDWAIAALSISLGIPF